MMLWFDTDVDVDLHGGLHGYARLI